jgi:hypothetical protein
MPRGAGERSCVCVCVCVCVYVPIPRGSDTLSHERRRCNATGQSVWSKQICDDEWAVDGVLLDSVEWSREGVGMHRVRLGSWGSGCRQNNATGNVGCCGIPGWRVWLPRLCLACLACACLAAVQCRQLPSESWSAMACEGPAATRVCHPALLQSSGDELQMTCREREVVNGPMLSNFSFARNCSAETSIALIISYRSNFHCSLHHFVSQQLPLLSSSFCIASPWQEYSHHFFDRS